MPKYSPADALKTFLLEGHAISKIEAMLLFGVQSPQREIARLKNMGFVIGTQRVPMIKILARLNKYAVCQSPSNLPVREILMTEYWIKS
jgi:hypothetical protein